MAIDRPAGRPTVPDVLPLVQRFMRREPVGGVLHVVLEDGNLEDKFLTSDGEWQADLREDADAMKILALLRQMTMTQRRRVYARARGTDYL